MNIGDKLRKIREAKDYSQEYLATKLKITQPSYARIENGCTRLSTDRLEKIAEVLGISPELILNFEDKYMLHRSIEQSTTDHTNQDHNGHNHAKTIELLEQEVKDLREERNRLLGIIEGFSK